MISPATVKKHLPDLPPPVWIRWLPFWHSANFMLILAITVMVLRSQKTFEQALLFFAMSLLWSCWYYICMRMKPNWWENHMSSLYLYLLLGGILWITFGITNSNYLYLSFTLYMQIFLLVPLPWKAILAIIVASVQVALDVLANREWSVYYFIPYAITLFSILVALFITSIIQQSMMQRHLIKALEIQRKQLIEEERRAGIAEERQRLAYEIHDTLTQGFTSILMHLEAANILLPKNTDEVRQHLAQARLTASENIVEARHLIWTLQPDSSNHIMLPEALHTLAKRWESECGITVTVNVTGILRVLRPNYEHTLLRATQEALTNVRKHAHATHVTVTLSYMEDAVMLDVQDNGRGFCQDELQSHNELRRVGGFGLQGLKTRVEKLGGTLIIESSSVEGTTIAVALPETQAHNAEEAAQ